MKPQEERWEAIQFGVKSEDENGKSKRKQQK